MSQQRGRIALMGSGELTSTMVDVHKSLLSRSAKAVFLDTPAGFQLNVDDISKKAQEYFTRHVQHPLAVASMKSVRKTTPIEKEKTYLQLQNAGYILIGPGSPSYFVNEARGTRIPEMIIHSIEAGGSFVAASAAALTVGEKTLPVYEIYKVGHDLHWIEGLGILRHFGFNLVVVPHWNNAEGGTHDTRFCFMGEPRFRELEALLPEDRIILGLDEHTACIIDLAEDQVEIPGIGYVTVRQSGREMRFGKNDQPDIDLLRRGIGSGSHEVSSQVAEKRDNGPKSEGRDDAGAESDGFWETVHRLESDFKSGLAEHDEQKAISALLELDRLIWKAHMDLENDELISQAREVFRDLIVLMGMEMGRQPESFESAVGPLVEGLLVLRAQYRDQKRWADADALRDLLQEMNIVIEDTESGTRWRVQDDGARGRQEEPDAV